VTTLTTEQAIIRDLDRAWTDLMRLRLQAEDDRFYSYEDRFNSVGYQETARRSIARYREELDTHRAQAAEFAARVERLTDAAAIVGDPLLTALGYLVHGPAVLPDSDTSTKEPATTPQCAMFELRLIDPNGYTVPTGIRIVEASAKDATKNELLTVDAVQDAERWSDFAKYWPTDYRVQITPLPNDAP
jgi:hypothetical protein